MHIDEQDELFMHHTFHFRATVVSVFAQKMLAGLSAALGLAVRLDQDGNCALQLEDASVVVMSFPAMEDVCLMCTDLLMAPRAISQNVFVEALHLNTNLVTQNAGALSYLHASQGIAYIWLWRPLNEEATLHDALSQFVQRSRVLRQALEQTRNTAFERQYGVQPLAAVDMEATRPGGTIA